jgi:hypothetical protein
MESESDQAQGLASLPPVIFRRRRQWLTPLIVVATCLAVLVAGYLFVRSLIDSGITKGPDAMFGDQNLKSSVALIELHKIRYGRYPETLAELKFLGQWDPIWIGAVKYWTNSDGTKYHIEVTRGWVGKPSLTMPPEFWQGTGYSQDLAPPQSSK